MSMQSGPTVPPSTGSSTFLSPASTITLFLSATTRSWILGCFLGKQELSHNPIRREREESPGVGLPAGGPETTTAACAAVGIAAFQAATPPGTQAFCAP